MLCLSILSNSLWVQVVKCDIHITSSEACSHCSLENFLTKNSQALIKTVVCGLYYIILQESSPRRLTGRNTFKTQVQQGPHNLKLIPIM